MVWKYNIVSKFNKNSIYWNSRLISQILTFLYKRDVYLKYYRVKKNSFLKLIDYSEFLDGEIELYLIKRSKNVRRKIFYSQLKITRLANWLFIYSITYNTYKIKKKIIIKFQESYFRLRHYYHYLSPKLNNFNVFV